VNSPVCRNVSCGMRGLFCGYPNSNGVECCIAVRGIQPLCGCALLLGYHALHYHALHAWLLTFNPVGVVLRWFVTTHCIRGFIGCCPMVGYIWLSALVWWLLMVGDFLQGGKNRMDGGMWFCRAVNTGCFWVLHVAGG